jgi:hypothetical protein
MVLNVDNLFLSSNLFKSSPEDGQVGVYSGNRIIPSTVADTVTLTPLESALNVLGLQEAAAITPGDYIGLEMDVFSDATGFLNTINTGSTTAVFSTNLYENRLAIADGPSMGGISYSSSTVNTKRGIKYHTNFPLTVTTVGKDGTCTATVAYIYAADGTTLIAQANFSGNIATFTDGVILADNTDYYVLCDNGGANYTSRYDSTSVSFPFNSTNVNATA